MSRESDFISALRALATDPAARGLRDDAAVMEIGGTGLVLTHDMIVEGVHFLATDPPADVAWKLLAVNLSDLAAKGATPVGALLGYSLGHADWDAAFLDGLRDALAAFAVPLLGGDTVAAPSGAARTFSLTALGTAGVVPSRSGAAEGDGLFVTGTIGDAGPGLEIAAGRRDGPAELLAAYRRPQPRLEEGRRLAPHVHAMMDISDGLLIDASRMAEASGLAVVIDLDLIPLSDALTRLVGKDREARLRAAQAGDDYELLFAAPVLPDGVAATCIGRFAAGAGLSLEDAAGAVPLPSRLGYEHGETR
ncbi:thiamine-phosphate kinase [Sphingomonas sp. LY54]|uniref:thiamine-phosphate kinase n=1 Tax=Sphingomonas sp. LY54 TaxID=3095343 RepID=UPI002D79A0AF|nr:thiamine-phosphate kinase [Sphingomonas sp. LY54]WRP27630.1 thiamine-phosphate kinase [Sphingomonas sp. LY54]